MGVLVKINLISCELALDKDLIYRGINAVDHKQKSRGCEQNGFITINGVGKNHLRLGRSVHNSHC